MARFSRLALTAVILGVAQMSAAAIDELWTKSNVFSGRTSMIEAVTIDSENNCYVAGRSSNGGDWDVHVAKYGPNSRLLWSKTYPAAGTQTATSLAIDSSAAGALYVETKDDAVDKSISVRKLKLSDGGTEWTSNISDPTRLYLPHGVYADQAGHVYWVMTVQNDAFYREVVVRTFSGGPTSTRGSYPIAQNDTVSDVAVHPSQGVYIATSFTEYVGDIARVDPFGAVFGPKPAGYSSKLAVGGTALFTLGARLSLESESNGLLLQQYSNSLSHQATRSRVPSNGIECGLFATGGRWYALVISQPCFVWTPDGSLNLPATSTATTAMKMAANADRSLLILMQGAVGIHQIGDPLELKATFPYPGVSRIAMSPDGHAVFANGTSGQIKCCQVSAQ